MEEEKKEIKINKKDFVAPLTLAGLLSAFILGLPILFDEIILLFYAVPVVAVLAGVCLFLVFKPERSRFIFWLFAIFIPLYIVFAFWANPNIRDEFFFLLFFIALTLVGILPIARLNIKKYKLSFKKVFWYGFKYLIIVLIVFSSTFYFVESGTNGAKLVFYDLPVYLANKVTCTIKGGEFLGANEGSGFAYALPYVPPMFKDFACAYKTSDAGEPCYGGSECEGACISSMFFSLGFKDKYIMPDGESIYVDKVFEDFKGGLLIDKEGYHMGTCSEYDDYPYRKSGGFSCGSVYLKEKSKVGVDDFDDFCPISY